jgi:hypothetical protein
MYVTTTSYSRVGRKKEVVNQYQMEIESLTSSIQNKYNFFWRIIRSLSTNKQIVATQHITNDVHFNRLMSQIPTYYTFPPTWWWCVYVLYYIIKKKKKSKKERGRKSFCVVV